MEKMLIVSEKEKNERGFVITPSLLAEEMVSKISTDFWKKTHSVLDPCCGYGIFPLLVFELFDRHLPIRNKEKRVRTIVEKCIFFSDISSYNVKITKQLLQFHCDKVVGEKVEGLKFNCWVGDTLTLNPEKEWKVKGFDAVIGNPPYNSIGGIRKGGKNLYTPFTMYAINKTKKNGYILYIVPTGILKTTEYNKKTELFNEITKHTIRHININECAKHFNVSSTFTYLLIQKDYNKSDIVYNVTSEINNKKYEVEKININSINFIPIIATKESISILNKCSKKNLNMKRVDKTSDIAKFDFNKFLYIKRLNHINYKNPYLKVFIGDRTLKINGPILYTKYSKNCEILLRSKIMAFFNIITRFDGVIYHNFINMFGIDNNIIRNENDLYNIFNLTKKEIKLIEETVKTRDLNN